MNKKFYTLSLFSVIATAFVVSPSVGLTGTLDTGSPGEEIVIDAVAADAATGTAARPEFKFQPSPQVKVVGDSDDKAFSLAAAHIGVFEKDNGEAYAMTSEASGLFTMKTPAEADIAVGAPGYLTADYTLPDGTTYTATP